MKPKKKIKKPEEEDEEEPSKSYVQLGDMIISTSSGNLSKCKRLAEDMLKSQNIKNYLGFFKSKKLLTVPNYYG